MVMGKIISVLTNDKNLKICWNKFNSKPQDLYKIGNFTKRPKTRSEQS